MELTKTIEIPIDKPKTALWLLALVLLGYLGVWLLQNNDTFTSYFAKRYAFPTGVAFVLSALLLGPFYVIKLFAKSPGFIISDKGITDNSSMTSHGFIPLADIALIDEARISVRNCITVSLKNPQAYLDDSTASWYRQMAWSSTYKRYGVSVLLSNAVLKCSYDELLTMLKSGLEKYHANAVINK